MHKMHNSLIIKTSSAFFISLLIASPALANCPSGYGETKEYRDGYTSAVMLDPETPYSPEYLIKCKEIPNNTYGAQCGSLKIKYLGDGYLYVQPSNPSLRTVEFQDIHSEYLGRFNLPRGFQDEKRKEWCEMDETKVGSSSSATCYRESRYNSLLLPSEYFIDRRFRGIRKKVFVERVSRTITECAKISL